MKVENYLRMTGIPYEVVDDFDLAKAPKGKLPYIEDAGGLILDYLKATYGDPLGRFRLAFLPDAILLRIHFALVVVL
jgi:glutathione S-transferase